MARRQGGKEARRLHHEIASSAVPPDLLESFLGFIRSYSSTVSIAVLQQHEKKKRPWLLPKVFRYCTLQVPAQHPGRRRYCIIRHLTAITSCEIGSEHLTFGESKHTATSNQGVQRRSSKEHPAVLSPTNTTTPLTWTSNTTTQHNTTQQHCSTSQLLNFWPTFSLQHS